MFIRTSVKLERVRSIFMHNGSEDKLGVLGSDFIIIILVDSSVGGIF